MGGWIPKESLHGFVTQRGGRGRGGVCGWGVNKGWGVSSDCSHNVINAGVFHDWVHLR